jgi:cytochrome c oxidase cbb3-type subunit 1
MMFFGGLYYAVPRLTGRPWASAGLTNGHRVLAVLGVALLVVSLAAAGWKQGASLMDPKTPLGDIFGQLRVSLMAGTVAQLVLLTANLLLVVNFFQSICSKRTAVVSVESPFRQPTVLEVHAS